VNSLSKTVTRQRAEVVCLSRVGVLHKRLQISSFFLAERERERRGYA